MTKLILFLIKGAIIFVVLLIITFAKEFGFSYVIALIIGASIIIPVWKYKPNRKKIEAESKDLNKD